MRIYVLGSTAFYKEMVAAKDALRALGYDGWIHPHYEAMARGEMDAQLSRRASGESTEVKRENDYFRVHYKHICESDGILVVNGTKNGVENYIGGNVLIEMGQAYVHDKKIFLLNAIPMNMSYTDEIQAMDPICLYGDLKKIVA